MASNPSPSDTVIPKSYSKGIGETPDPLAACAQLAHGSDRSFASSVNQQVVQTPPSGHPQLEARLSATLAQPGGTDAGREFLCQMLSLVGSARSVPALAVLLRDPKSTEAARYALEMIPGPEADAALRAALDSLKGDAKAGLIGSIAARGDAAARPALAALKDNRAEPPLVRDAAARAFAALPNS